tara:strand:+ start:1098 stop:1316 length:219 start_codon:yes stop_codon:yes gene_type:complete
MKTEDLIFKILTVLAVIGAIVFGVFFMFQLIKAVFLGIYFVIVNPILAICVSSVAVVLLSIYFISQDKKRNR